MSQPAHQEEVTIPEGGEQEDLLRVHAVGEALRDASRAWLSLYFTRQSCPTRPGSLSPARLVLASGRYTAAGMRTGK